MQHLLDNPGFVTALITLILAAAGYLGVKTEQARQGERIVGLQRQADLPPPAAPAVAAPLAVPQPAVPPVATTVLTLPANGTAVTIEAVRATPAPLAAPSVPADAPVGPSGGVVDPTDREPPPPVTP